MKRCFVAWCATILACMCFLSEPVFAVPGQISYQGKLTDNMGTPLETPQDMMFILYDSAVDGKAIWKEAQNIPVTGGIYDVRLGSENPLDTALFAGDTLYLQVEIYNGYDWEILSPRQQLTSTAFAFMAEKAADADTLGGMTLSQIHAEETDPTVLASVKDGVAWGEVSGIPTGFADGIDADSGGDITGVTAGTGLTGGGISGDVTINVNTSAIQQRLTGACAAGSSIRTVNENGSVVCEADDTGITSETDPQVGAILTGYVPRWDGSALVSGAMYDNGAGRIGIGTTAPNEQLELTGNLRLPDSTTTAGIIRSGANTLIHTYGARNFFAGENAGNLTMTGFDNAASGNYALSSNSTGESNTASGAFALRFNTTGNNNTASGYEALYSNTNGYNNTASGYRALFLNITGYNNTASGYQALLSNTGSFNTANGSGSLATNTTGENNTASGAYALKSNTDGLRNTACGSYSLSLNTRGIDNTATGHTALYSNTEGHYNTASGSYSLYSNTTGSENTASGKNALYSNTTGSANTASGYQALYKNTTGTNNTASGSSALVSNTTGVNDTANGSGALVYNTEGDNNTASGVFALYTNHSGDNNTASGASALYSNIDGNENTASGFSALFSNISGSQNTASGNFALHQNTYGIENTASGKYALHNNTIGKQNTASGVHAGGTNTEGSYNTFIGAWSDAALHANSLTNATAIGHGAIVSGSNRVRIGDTAVTQIGGQVAWTNLSDMRHKRDIADIGPGLDFITALRPVQFRMLDGNDRLDFGFIAQDIEALLGEDYNILGIDGDPDRTLSLRYTDFIAPMVKAMQEQQGQIEEQKEIIERQEGFMSAMRSEMDAMKAEIKAIRAGK